MSRSGMTVKHFNLTHRQAKGKVTPYNWRRPCALVVTLLLVSQLQVPMYWHIMAYRPTLRNSKPELHHWRSCVGLIPGPPSLRLTGHKGPYCPTRGNQSVDPKRRHHQAH